MALYLNKLCERVEHEIIIRIASELELIIRVLDISEPKHEIKI